MLLGGRGGMARVGDFRGDVRRSFLRSMRGNAYRLDLIILLFKLSYVDG